MPVKISCPTCSAENSFFLTNGKYSGPFRCWKCRATFLLQIADNQFKTCQPINAAEFDRLTNKRKG